MDFIAVSDKRKLVAETLKELLAKVEAAPDDEGFNVFRIKDGVKTMLGEDGLFREV